MLFTKTKTKTNNISIILFFENKIIILPHDLRFKTKLLPLLSHYTLYCNCICIGQQEMGPEFHLQMCYMIQSSI